MADKDLDDFDLDDDDVGGSSGVPAPTDFDDDDDFDFDDDFEKQSGSKFNFKEIWETKKKLILIGVGAFVGLSALGGGAYWFMSGDDTETAVEEKSRGGVGSAVGLALQQQATSGLTPQSKLTVGGATGGGKLSVGAAQTMQEGETPKLGLQTPQGSQLAASTSGTNAPSGMGGYDPDNETTPLSTAAVAEVGINIPAVLPSAFADMGAPKQAQPLAPANDEGLMESTQNGTLPKIAEDGREPWRSYARPMAGDPNTPAVSLVVTGLGLSATLTEAAISHLPADVTLSFSPYGRGIKDWVERARNMGHEVLLELPMESESFPVDDPGPLAMMTSKKPAENLQLLNLMMAQAQGYVGFVGQFGSKFLRDRKAMTPVLGELKARGLLFIDPRTANGGVTLEMADQMQLARAIADATVNTNASTDKIRAQLETLATIAKNQGGTVAMIHATPASLKTIKAWAEKLNGVQIAPMSSMAGRQKS